MNDIALLKNLTLLYAEDNKEARELNSKIFEFFFKNIIAVKDGLEALEIYDNQLVDLVILDISMPKLDGLSVARKIREIDSKIPILILTNLLEIAPLKEAVSLNLVDYLIKPISFEILKNSLLKSIQQMKMNNLLKIYIDDNIWYYMQNKVVLVNNRIITLSKKENILLELLCKNKGNLLENDYLENIIFQENITNSSLKNLVYSLRKKLGTKNIQNSKELGYILL